ncbi:MAG: carboxypeptidase-like regulatory domain-containing protein [Planctomycetota bacterium]
MSSASKVVAVAALLAILAAAFWFANSERAPDLPTAEAAESESKPAADLALPDAVTAPERESVAPQAPPATTKPAPNDASLSVSKDKPSTDLIARVRARFVDPAGQPWDRVSFSDASDGDPSTTAGPDGRAELVFEHLRGERDQNIQFVASREGCATRAMRGTLVPGQLLDLGEVVIERECRIQGLVHDNKDKGLADITVGLALVDIRESNMARLRRHGSSVFDRSIVAKSDERGHFDLRGIPAGSWRLWGKGDARGYGVSEPFELHAGEQKLDLDFEVPALLATDSIQGIVLDPAGQGVPGANLSISYTSDHESGTSGENARPDGTFEILIQLDLLNDLVASDKDHRWGDAALRDVPPGARGLVLQLQDPSAQPKAKLRIHGPGNEPVREAKVESRAGKPNSYTSNFVATKELDPGTYEFQVPLASFGMAVSAQGYLGSELIKFDPASFPAETEVALALAPVLRGRVRADGKAIEGAVIEAKREHKRGTLTFNGFPCLMAPHEQVHTKSAADGSFSLPLESQEAVYLRCTALGFASTVVGPFDVGGSPAPIDIELNAGGAIEGRVRGKDGNPVVGAIVGVTCGDGHPRTMRSGHDGVFRFEGLSTRGWIVIERDIEFRTDYTNTNSNDEESHVDWSCEVTAGRTTYRDLVLDH